MLSSGSLDALCYIEDRPFSLCEGRVSLDFWPPSDVKEGRHGSDVSIG
jgi:hypothetical protein